MDEALNCPCGKELLKSKGKPFKYCSQKCNSHAYWLRNKQKCSLYQKKYHLQHPGLSKLQFKKWYLKNTEYDKLRCKLWKNKHPGYDGWYKKHKKKIINKIDFSYLDVETSNLHPYSFNRNRV